MVNISLIKEDFFSQQRTFYNINNAHLQKEEERMTESIFQIANSWGLWLVSFILVAIVLIQAMLYTRLAFKSAEKIGFPKEKCMQGFRSGMISAIGPSIAVFIVMVGMMSVLGGPITWLRLSIIGSAATELTASKLSADVMGIAFNVNEFDGTALANAFWAMSINGCGWLLVVGLFANKMESIRQKIGGGDPKWLALFGLSASLGAFAYMNSTSIFPVVMASLKNTVVSYGPIAACFGGMISMIFVVKLSRKFTWLREYTLGIAMLVGMALAIVAS